MSTVDTQTEAILTLHFPQKVAEEMERSAHEQKTDVSTLLTKSYRAYKMGQLREHLQRTRPAHTADLPPEMQDIIESYVDEARAEFFRDRGF